MKAELVQNYKKYFAIALVIIGILVIAFVSKSDEGGELTMKSEPSEYSEEDGGSNSNQLSPEEVLASMEVEEFIYDPNKETTIEIIGPEEPTFVMGQARHYEAQIKNRIKDVMYCKWDFYMSLKEKEDLYRTQITKVAGDNICGFTSTFISQRGILRVVVSLVDSKDSVTSVAKDERNYTVQ